MQREVFALARACKPDVALFAGDAAYAGSSDGLRRRMLRSWRHDWGSLWERVYAVPGNHDLDSPRGVEIWHAVVPARRPAPPDPAGFGFLVRIGPVLVVGLDSSPGLIDALQREWMMGMFARAREPHRIAVYHEPAFPLGLHRGHSLDALPHERDQLWATLEEGGVGIVVNGHEHLYARMEVRRRIPIQQVITGGAGGDLYTDVPPGYDVCRPEHHLIVMDADARRIVLRAVDLTGALIDEIEVSPSRATEVAT
ncbi:MAG: metallophosphoesterase [Dehalococcoidia bacterium]